MLVDRLHQRSARVCALNVTPFDNAHFSLVHPATFAVAALAAPCQYELLESGTGF
jgi:hypothetical protein